MTELGQALKEAREEKGMSLDDVQDITKIQKRYLAAIEKGDYGNLPGSFYTRAFIKNYAEAVGLNPRKLFDEHPSEVPDIERTGDQLPARSKRQVIKPKDSFLSSAAPKIATVLVLLAVLVGIYYVAQHLITGDQAPDTDPGLTTEEGMDIGDKTYEQGNDDSGQGTTDQENKPTDEDSTDQTEEKPEDNQPKQSITLTNEDKNMPQYVLSGTDKFSIEISAKEGTNSWITLRKTNQSGENLYFDFVSNGSQDKNDAKFAKDLTGIKTVYLKVGNAPSTIIKINGETLTFPNDETTQEFTIKYTP